MRFTPDSNAQEPSLVLQCNGKPMFSIHLSNVLSIGRESSNDLAIPGDTFVSKSHARIIRAGDCFFIEDLSSTNGTYVNKVRAQSRTLLKSGDTILIGTTILEFRQREQVVRKDLTPTENAVVDDVFQVYRTSVGASSVHNK